MTAVSSSSIGTRCDVCVVGGGPAGAAAALAASTLGAHVCLVAPEPKPVRASLELLSGRARAALVALGLLDVVTSGAETCVGTVMRWAGAGFDEQSCLLDPHGGGWIVDRARLDTALRAAAARRGVSVISERAVEASETPDGLGHVRLHRRGVTADDVIVAVGRGGGPVRRYARHDVRHRIVALDVRCEPGTIPGLGSRLLIDCAPNGWWYALANSTTTHVVYCTEASVLASGAAGVAAAWAQACRSAMDWLPSAASAARPQVMSATIGNTAPVVTGALRLVGDVALAVDPLSGHGLALALQAASRYHDADYPDWVDETRRAHEKMEREVYQAACGAVDGPFWVVRRRR